MNKYKAIRTEADGIIFDSKKEALRYSELKMLERAGIIRDLRWQVPFDLFASSPEGKSEKVGVYKADFVYQSCETGRTTVEDVKGISTPMFKWKRKHFEIQYGLRIILT